MRFLFNLLFLALLVVVAVGAYFWSSRTTTVANTMSNMMGVTVSIDDIQLGWNKLVIRGLDIGVPTGSKIDRSFRSDIHVQVNLADLLGDTMTIQDVNVPKPDIGVELYDRSGNDNNWTRIANHIASKQTATAQAEEKKVLIKHLLVSDMAVTVAGSPVSKEPITVHPKENLELYDVGGDKPLPLDQITAIIVRALMKHMTSIQGLTNLTKGLLEGTTDIIKKPVDIIDSILPGKKKPPTEGGSDGGGIKESFKGLFK